MKISSKFSFIIPFVIILSIILPITPAHADVGTIHVVTDWSKNARKCSFSLVASKIGQHDEALPVLVTRYIGYKSNSFNGWHYKGTIEQSDDSIFFKMNELKTEMDHYIVVAFWGEYHFSRRFIKINFRPECLTVSLSYYKDWAGGCEIFMPNYDPIPAEFFEEDCWQNTFTY